MFNNELWQKPAGGAGGSAFYDYQIPKSCRFSNQNNYLKGPSNTAGADKKYTVSVWVKRTSFDKYSAVMGDSLGNWTLNFDSNNHLALSSHTEVKTTGVFRDPSAWYHIVAGNGPNSGDGFIYVNGVEQVLSGNTFNTNSGMFRSGTSVNIGQSNNAGYAYEFPGYIAECIGLYDITKSASDFGEFKNGVWIPKEYTSFTTSQSFYLKFENASDLGNDSSGNNRDFTSYNMGTDHQVLDSPTFNSSSNGGNFATIGPLWKTSDMTFSEGNLKWTCATNQRGLMSNWAVPIGTKAYWEYIPVTFGGNTSNGDEMWIGINQGIAALVGGDRGGRTTGYAYGTSNGYKTILASASSYGATIRSGDIVGVAVDRVNHTINFSKNGSWQGTFAISSTMDLFPFIGSGGGTSSASGIFNFGADGTFSGTVTAQGNSDDTGYGDFYYAPPTGFLAMCAGNLPTADAVDPAQTDDNYPQELFNPVLYTGSGGTQTITGVGFQPDFTWIKNRGASADHVLMDSTRGAYGTNDYYYLRSNTTAAQDHTTDFHNFASDGFIVSGTGSYFNASGNTFVGWNWRANGGTTSSNGNGSITSTVQADPSGGFSIVTYTGNATAGTRGHGLSAAPTFYIVRDINNGNNWVVYAKGAGETKFGVLDSTAAFATDPMFNNTAPTNTVFSVGTSTETNGSGRNYIAYCFADVEGYIKSGEYVGNGDADGPFVYTGFRPAMVIMKDYSAVDDWVLYDDKRAGYNLSQSGNTALYPNESYAQDNYFTIDILSNGFKFRTSSGTINASSANYIYLAFAQNPFQYATAR